MSLIACALIIFAFANSSFAAFPEMKEIKPGEPVCVTKYNTELHRQPGAKTPVSWIVGKNMPFLKIGEARDKQRVRWFFVRDLDGAKHWIRASAVTDKYICAVTLRDRTPLREGPSADASEADFTSVEKYTPYKKIDRDGEFVQIEDDQNGQYWTHESNVWIPAMRSSVSF